MDHPCTPSFETLYTREGLATVHAQFEAFLKQEGFWNLYQTLPQLKGSSMGEALVTLAPLLERFLGRLFHIEQELEKLSTSEHDLSPLYACKRHFVQRRIARTKPEHLPEDITPVKEKLSEAYGEVFDGDEDLFARHVLTWLQEGSEALLWAEQYAAWALYSSAGQEAHMHGTLFKLPKKLDYQNLISRDLTRDRKGFDLTDDPITPAYASDQAHYCIGCHKQEKDSCRTGFEGKTNPLGEKLEGCPLEQRISEMSVLKAQGHVLAALAVITMDNPMVAATGRRICNACSKACIFQKQTPVDIPSVETHILEQILDLPWGFEIYSLLTRWNPLKVNQKLPAAPTHRRVLVAGMGPAGFALAHHLSQDGHTVVGIDGLKIEPLPENLQELRLIQTIKDHFEPLSQRTRAGFGGVAEYGITARWNKNFLLVIRLLLERNHNVILYGSTRLESTLTTQQAFELGFDHVALCLGAGKPHIPTLENIHAKGVHHASDFLMALHLAGPSAQVPTIELPAVVIGAGLTAVDAATEALAYAREQSANIQGKPMGSEGVSLLYRRSLQDAPAYRKNPDELEKALAEGVEFLAHKTPQKIHVDKENHVTGIECTDGTRINARTILIATGTKPNTVIAEENPSLFKQDEDFLAFSDPRISVLGDLHPDFTGSVVHALASAKKIAPHITAKLPPKETAKPLDLGDFLQSTLVSKETSGAHLKVTVKAPMAARNLKPGQFFRLQPYGDQSDRPQNFALMGVLERPDHVTFYIKQGSKAARFVEELPIGSPLALMGPTGSPLEIPENKRVLLVGDEPVLEFIGQAMEQRGCAVFYNAACSDKIDFVFTLKDMDSVENRDLLKDTTPILTMARAPMQCMMKGICARCIRQGPDGTIVFSCQQQFEQIG